MTSSAESFHPMSVTALLPPPPPPSAYECPPVPLSSLPLLLPSSLPSSLPVGDVEPAGGEFEFAAVDVVVTVGVIQGSDTNKLLLSGSSSDWLLRLSTDPQLIP